MDWIIAVSPAERARGEILPETEREANRALREHGCVLLRGALPIETVDSMHQEFMSRYGSLDATSMQVQANKPPPNRFLKVGDDRYDIVLRMSGAFGRPDVFANRLLLRFLGQLLDNDMRLNSFTCVVSFPGSSAQHVHRDHGHLFADPNFASNLPIYAVNVAVPLIDVDLETGPTGIFLGSHRWPSQVAKPRPEAATVVPFQRGDCVLLDYRTLHTGLSNQSNRVRPIVYMVYSRMWFFDAANHLGRAPLDISLEEFFALSESTRALLARAYTYIMCTRWNEADLSRRDEVDISAAVANRGINDLSSGIATRNQPCPCGSGKRFKHCHGQLVANL